MLLTDTRGIVRDDPAFVYELKLDGIRGVVVKAVGLTRIFTRHLREVTEAFPEVVAGVNEAVKGDAILDGELICPAPNDGRPDFYAVNARQLLLDPMKVVQATRSSPSTFMAFDVIERQGNPVTSLPLSERKEILAGVVTPTEAVQVVEMFPGTAGSSLLAVVAERDLEGVVAKRISSRYYLDYRSPDWLKVKVWKERTVTLLGVRWEPEFGVLVGDPGHPPLCVVELGWTPTDRGALVRLLPELGERSEKKITWLRPLLCGRIRYRVTPTGRLREPVWSGFVLSSMNPRSNGSPLSSGERPPL